jgi:hypothetical protein
VNCDDRDSNPGPLAYKPPEGYQSANSAQLRKLPLLTVGIPEVHTRRNPIFGPNFIYSLLRPQKHQNRNKTKMPNKILRARPQISL